MPELIAIILRTGSGQDTSVDLGRYILKLFGGLRGIDSQPVTELCKIKGIGNAKASQLKAALELSKRLVQQKWRGYGQSLQFRRCIPAFASAHARFGTGGISRSLFDRQK